MNSRHPAITSQLLPQSASQSSFSVLHTPLKSILVSNVLNLQQIHQRMESRLAPSAKRKINDATTTKTFRELKWANQSKEWHFIVCFSIYYSIYVLFEGVMLPNWFESVFSTKANKSHTIPRHRRGDHRTIIIILKQVSSKVNRGNTSSTNSNITIDYQNVRGLRMKQQKFFRNSSSVDYSIVALTETWLNSSFFSTEHFDHSFNVHRNDRESTASKVARLLPFDTLLYRVISNWKGLMKLKHTCVQIHKWLHLRCISSTATIYWFVHVTFGCFNEWLRTGVFAEAWKR